MANVNRVRGVAQILRNLEKSDKNIRSALRKALVKAGLFLQRESQKLVPVQTGNLKATAYTREVGLVGSHKEAVQVGYTAAYAIYVHENLEAAHGAEFNVVHSEEIANAKGKGRKVWFNRGSDQQAKFLERPFRERRFEIRQIIDTEMEGKIK
jgi:hypothetical protein